MSYKVDTPRTEIVDELVTPGCPQCAIKHLSAALSYVADMDPVSRDRLQTFDVFTAMSDVFLAEQILRARAFINYAEVCVGYKSHLPFVVGLLERAERQQLVAYGETTSMLNAIRDVRRTLQDGGVLSQGALAHLANTIESVSYAWAHLFEARRELPALLQSLIRLDTNDLQSAIIDIYSDYFDVPTVGTGSEGNEEHQQEDQK